MFIVVNSMRFARMFIVHRALRDTTGVSESWRSTSKYHTNWLKYAAQLYALLVLRCDSRWKPEMYKRQEAEQWDEIVSFLQRLLPLAGSSDTEFATVAWTAFKNRMSNANAASKWEYRFHNKFGEEAGKHATHCQALMKLNV